MNAVVSSKHREHVEIQSIGLAKPPIMSLTRGAFIVIEGLDRSGKSTQTARLVERLEREGCTVKLHKFPGGRLDRSHEELNS